ncbi:hypothetical protein NQ317_013585 [Molorchus minor]|uniref:E3 ubiquitin-protein ligase n=1 Tax=Molorchus minor TaxID=1323400 RepID=A0ABQ9J024_9CUCU|nr:hypothetical protein NQ317_013585 [Molorchus minor]
MAEALEKSLLEELQCPVCDILKTCPKCRSPKSQARSFGLESIFVKLHIPCRYSMEGCEFVSLGEKIRSHEIYCIYATRPCPFKHYDNCHWKDTATKLKAHLIRKHPNNFYTKEKQRFLAQNFRSIASYHYIYVVIYAFKDFFRLTWEMNDDTGMTRWAIYYMGPPEQAKKYSYKIEFPREPFYDDHISSIVWKSPCDSMPEDESKKFVEYNCLHVHRDLLKSYCEPNGDLNYKVSIYGSNTQKSVMYANDIGGLFTELSVAD